MSVITNAPPEIAAAHLPAVPLTLEGASMLHQMLRVRWTAWKQLPAAERAQIAQEAATVLSEMEREAGGQSAVFSLLAGDLSVDDIPGAWNEMFARLFGRTPPDHARGCLQDIHWAAALFGYFPNYALGEALGAQLFETACAADPAILAGLGRGDFKPYFAWVRPRIHEQASLKSFDDIVVAATGAKLSGDALKRHVKRRYLDETLD